MADHLSFLSLVASDPLLIISLIGFAAGAIACGWFVGSGGATR